MISPNSKNVVAEQTCPSKAAELQSTKTANSKAHEATDQSSKFQHSSFKKNESIFSKINLKQQEIL